jgi:signal transduction histidine kinase/CheY-like chemotaxis protein/HPt (histidine-containing phosphotransfer) domain-containing protein
VSPSPQLDLLAKLGYAVFERSTNGFELLSSAPEWLPAGPISEAFPFLDVFLPDAEEFWADPRGCSTLPSDFWTQPGADGGNLHFSATAIAGERKLLLIERVGNRFEQTQQLMQYAHETKLAHDEIARLSRELKRATEAKSEFLARMSHEIRTPMNSLLGVAELLSETALNDEQSEYVRIFRRAGDNLLNVINDILDFSKIEAGQVELECVAFDLVEVVQEAIEIIGVRARAKGLCLNCDIRPEVPPRLMGDPGRLRQIILNLLSNAVKFTDQGGITTRVEPDRENPSAGAIHFKVRDTGIGIPADRVSTIFDSFTQADASTTRKYGGTGLGLAISKRFVELMGGRIWAESTPGQGSTMHFTARFAVSEPASNVPAPKATPPTLGNRALRILLADDSDDNRFLVRGYLRDTGCVIDEVKNGAEVVELFKAGTYDMVLMDAEMPVMDGYAATRAMRALEQKRAGPETPILALTAHALKEARDRSIQAGCTDHLTKPITKTALLEAIGRYAPVAPSAERIPVTVESWLKPVIPAYLEKRRADVAKLRVALEQREFSTVRTLGHQMAGSGAGYGFTQITQIGEMLEESALAEDAARIRDGISALDRYLINIVTE